MVNQPTNQPRPHPHPRLLPHPHSHPQPYPPPVSLRQLIPLARKGIQVTTVVNTAATIAQLIGIPAPKIPQEVIDGCQGSIDFLSKGSSAVPKTTTVCFHYGNIIKIPTFVNVGN